MDLKNKILNHPLPELLNILLFESIPMVFSGSLDAYRAWRYKLADALEVDPSEVIVVGSASVGYSLSPNKALKPFTSESDVDVAIISDHHFSYAWHYLRAVNLTLASLTAAQRASIKDHQTRLIYWGCVATDRVLPLLPFAQQWMAARSSMQNEPVTFGREINFRVYKDFRALRAYQFMSLSRLQANLSDET